MFRFGAAARPIVWLGLLVSSTDVFAGAWTLEEGRGQIVITATPSRADEAFDAARNPQPTPRYNKFEFQTLFEYGVTDRFTAILAPSLQHIDIAPPAGGQRTGFGFAEFGGRYRLLQGNNWVLSAQTTLRMPGTFDQANPAAIGYNGMETDLRALFGYSFSVGAWPSFLDIQLAQRLRSAGAPNELRADVTFGTRLLPQWLVLAQFFNVISEGASPPLFPSYDYSKFQLSVVYDLNRQWSLQAGGFTTYSGRNALQENGFVAGIWYRF